MQQARSRLLWATLLGVGLLRLVSLALYPLMDPTEARYGEIVRIMVETGNWLTPQIDYDLPFWGKPPLSFWASALSISIFWNSEFFLRLPHVLAAVAVLLLTWQFVVKLNFTRRQADGAIAIVATTIGFLITSGAVMTDMFLCLSMTMAMVGFWRGWHGEKAYVFVMYVGLGVGLLVKGPLILVLAGLAILPWIASTHGLIRMWRQIFQRLHVLSGILLMLLIAVPWYHLAEQATPGFLEYFIVGEHFQRFLDSGWKGDLYGSGHEKIRGTIWVYWLLFSLPWSPILLLAGISSVYRGNPVVPRDGLVFFLILWMCSPMLLFTMAGNVLPAYIVPGLPAIGLLVIKSFRDELVYRGRYLLLVGPAILLALSFYIVLYAGEKYSDKAMLASGIDSTDELFYFQRRSYSAQYYSNGRAKLIDSFPDQDRFYLVVENDVVLDEIGTHCQPRSKNSRRILYFCLRNKPS